MMDAATALSSLPKNLRDPLLKEYRSIIQNFSEHRWSPSELSGGLLCEIVYSVLDGYAKGTFPTSPAKPRDFVTACRQLEGNANVPRSFQILIPRALPALYEVRNNRGVGHVGGDVDPNHMDAALVVSMANWIMAELIRVFHGLPIKKAQELVDQIAERRTPLIWHGENVKRILDPKMSLPDKILIFLETSTGKLPTVDLLKWCDYDNRSYFFRLLRNLHSKRIVELSEDEASVEILPPGSKTASDLLRKKHQTV